MTDFALCRTCDLLTTGRVDSSKGWLLDPSSEHFGCEVVPFADLPNLPTPIRNTILRLGANAPIGDNDITMFKLGLTLEDQWTRSLSTAPVADNISAMSPAPVPESDASTRSPRALTPISAIGAEPNLLDLLNEAAS